MNRPHRSPSARGQARRSAPDGTPRRVLWGPVIGFGLVSLAADVVSDGARPLTGPLLAQLGASALVVGLVTGAAEAAAQGLRLVFGPWADHTRRYWSFTLAGYGLTAVCVPLLAVAPLAGTSGLVLASVLIIGDRIGKAVRSPAKTVLLAAVAKPVGRGRGFAVHKSLDLVGALLGPILVAVVLAATGNLSAAFAVLSIPAAAAMFLLFWLRRRIPDPGTRQPSRAAAGTADQARETAVVPGAPGVAGRPASLFTRSFVLFGAAAFCWSTGLVAFGVISFHLTTTAAVPVSVVALLYAAAMAAAALGALASGVLYDRSGAWVLLSIPVLTAPVPVLALAPAAGLTFLGVLAWGMAMGVQDSTVKALLADLVPEQRQGTAYGVFAAFQGAGALAGGALYGALYDTRELLIASVAVLQLLAVVVLVVAVRGTRSA
ncbi:MFS transporter [uncultured Arthrobacter sp.]|uniref:MFS transporter n=1 Tax=uncultured Arthrobacter sp. TaxID=114050 RepID=UPI0032170C2D